MVQETNAHASDFENKMILDARCSNKHTTYTAVETKDCISRCRVCNDMLYYVCCPKCDAGYMFCKKDDELNLVKQTWYCDICSQHNKLDPYAQEMKNYLPSEIPAGLLPRSVHPLVMIVALILLLLLISGILL